jgi:hypothetical protein
MAARAYYDAVNKRTCDGRYRALLGAALIEPDRFHRCASFCAYSLRGAYNYSQYQNNAAILEDRTDKVQLVHYNYSIGVRPRLSKFLYTFIVGDFVDVFDADPIQQRKPGFYIVSLAQKCSYDEFWALLN